MKPITLRLNPADNVIVALENLEKGTTINTESLTCRTRIPAGHKVATAAIAAGGILKKYGQFMGVATREIAPGDHVHTHNVGMQDYSMDQLDHADTCLATDSSPLTAHFDGILRPDGQVATRNYIGVISTVNCSASVCRFIADAFRGDALGPYPHVDGVVPIVHGSGCSLPPDGKGYAFLHDCVSGFARHPNFAGVLLVGLGCEVVQTDLVVAEGGFSEGTMFRTLNIQGSGGVRATVERGVAIVGEMLAEADKVRRQPLPASHLILGLQCGGSDGYSGITANPAMGAAVDRLVRCGGTAVLGETSEIYGAEHLLTCRADNPSVAQKLLERIRWWEEYTALNNAKMDNNPSPGNKEGGLTTILEKSLGAVAKAGSTPLMDVYEYARPITAKGLVFMDTPGNDPVSLTGMVAGGANVICFTTGRGSVYGCRPSPSIKLATNSEMYARLQDDMDINCGVTLEGTATVAEVGERIFERILTAASGDKTKSEQHGMGADEFVPWSVGAIL